MLAELAISNLAIIEHSIIRFEDGLNAITGETGAGKSILLDALGAVLGARVSSDLVRTGSSSARVEAQFELPPIGFEQILELLEEAGIEHMPEEPLIVAREIQANGRSSARINGRMVTVSQLNAIGKLLVDIHGQSDHLGILSASEQRRILDRYGGLEELRDAASIAIAEWNAARKALAELTTGSREREQRRDLLQFQVTEIEELAPVEGEDEALTRERDVLQNADALRLSSLSAMDALVGDASEENAVTLLRRVEHELQTTADIDSGADSLAERASELLILAEDLARDARDYAEQIEGDPERLAFVDDRLANLQQLKRKYGATIPEILSFRDRAAEELAELSADKYDPAALQARLELTTKDAQKAVATLSQARRDVASKLAETTVQSIADLRMGSAEVEILVEHVDDSRGLPMPDGQTIRVDDSGGDAVTFLIAPNRGEALKPLARIASGGETARVMLAIKSILSDVDDTPTLVFDEIDVGVGGRSGQMVGEKLWSLTDRHQVIVISHLAQIAAFADKHFRIAKSEEEDRVVSRVEELTPYTREQELAAMLDGIPATPESLANARAMLARVHEYRERRNGTAG